MTRGAVSIRFYHILTGSMKSSIIYQRKYKRIIRVETNRTFIKTKNMFLLRRNLIAQGFAHMENNTVQLLSK